MEGLSKTTENLSQNSRSPGRDLKKGLPKYETRVLPTRPLCLVTTVGNFSRTQEKTCAEPQGKILVVKSGSNNIF
jgi:hypothetical protein